MKLGCQPMVVASFKVEAGHVSADEPVRCLWITWFRDTDASLAMLEE